LQIITYCKHVYLLDRQCQAYKKITRISFDALDIKSVFGSVVVGVFQINFRAKMHANDVFSFF
jgi:hypothetical protein